MNGIAARPKIGYMVDGELQVLLNEVNTITELGDKVETGIKAKKWRATGITADDRIDIKMTGEMLEEINVAAMPTGDAAEMEVVYKKKYIPVRRHKKKRIAGKAYKAGIRLRKQLDCGIDHGKMQEMRTCFPGFSPISGLLSSLWPENAEVFSKWH